MAKKQQNYLDFIPVVNPQNSWTQDEQGIVTIDMVHRGFYARIAQKFFHTPNTAAFFGRKSTAYRPSATLQPK